MARAAALDGAALEEKEAQDSGRKGGGQGTGAEEHTRQATATSGAAAEAEADPGR